MFTKVSLSGKRWIIRFSYDICGAISVLWGHFTMQTLNLIIKGLYMQNHISHNNSKMDSIILTMDYNSVPEVAVNQGTISSVSGPLLSIHPARRGNEVSYNVHGPGAHMIFLCSAPQLLVQCWIGWGMAA